MNSTHFVYHILRRAVHARQCCVRFERHLTLHGHLSFISSLKTDQEMDYNASADHLWTDNIVHL
jgi:predicted transposase YbfD/YdcC